MEKQFHIGDVLSIIAGYQVSPRKKDGIYDILNFMTSDDMFVSQQLPRAFKDCKLYLLEQHPQLKCVDASGVTPKNWQEWLNKQIAYFGETLPVRPIPCGRHEFRDPKVTQKEESEIMSKGNDGYTLVELLLVITAIGILIVSGIGIFGICSGNFWYSNDSVLRELKADHSKITEVLKSKRNVFAKSVVTVKENGVNHDYCIDTNILWNYDFSECSK